MATKKSAATAATGLSDWIPTAGKPSQPRRLRRAMSTEGEDGLFTQSWFVICRSDEVKQGEAIGRGFLDGRVQVHGRLEVRATGLVKGKLHVGTLRIEEGALLDGQLQMAGASTAASVPGADLPTDLPRPRTSKTARAVDTILSDALEPMAVNE